MDTLDEDTQKNIDQKHLILFETENTLTALGQLARYQRLRSNVKVIAITGSAEKQPQENWLKKYLKPSFTPMQPLEILIMKSACHSPF